MGAAGRVPPPASPGPHDGAEKGPSRHRPGASAPAEDPRTVPEVPDEYLSRRTLPHHVRRTVGRLKTSAPHGDDSAPPSPLAPALAAARPATGVPSSPGGCRRLDSSGRLNARPLCSHLGWQAGTTVRFRPSAHGYVAVPTDRPGGRGSLTGRVDSEGRVRLPPAVAGRLDPDGRGEVYARAVADRLDDIGAIGIALTFNYGGFKGNEI